MTMLIPSTSWLRWQSTRTTMYTVKGRRKKSSKEFMQKVRYINTIVNVKHLFLSKGFTHLTPPLGSHQRLVVPSISFPTSLTSYYSLSIITIFLKNCTQCSHVCVPHSAHSSTLCYTFCFLEFLTPFSLLFTEPFPAPNLSTSSSS